MRKTTAKFILGALTASLAAFLLASCGTVHETGPGAGVSASAASTVAELRRENGVVPLKADATLEKAALQQAGYMARSGEMDHTTRLGRDFVSRMKKGKIHGLRAENIAHGAFGTSKVLDVWMHSPPHRKNMLDARIKRFGLAYVSDGNGRRYWAMVMAD
ncbi:MAG: CAP domain-containing protein [Hyphomicrobiales bacterium]|nr:CAP domain-containing protein [Hyphomicrobiales bacterium]